MSFQERCRLRSRSTGDLSQVLRLARRVPVSFPVPAYLYSQQFDYCITVLVMENIENASRFARDSDMSGSGSWTGPLPSFAAQWLWLESSAHDATVQRYAA